MKFRAFGRRDVVVNAFCDIRPGQRWGFNAVFQPRNEGYALFLNVPRL